MHSVNFVDLTNNSYLRADFKFVYYHDTVFTKLRSEWKDSVKLRQIISKIRNGKDFSKKAYADYETSACYIRVNNLKPLGEFVIEDIVYLKDKAIEPFSKLLINEGEVIITRSGTVGIAFKFNKSILPEEINEKDFMPAGYVIVLRIHNEFDNEYLKYFLYSSISRRYFEALACGKSQQNISQSDLGKWIIPLDLLENIPIEEIKEKEKQTTNLRSQIKEPKQIVDEVLSEYFSYDLEKFLEFERQYFFKENLSNFSKSFQLRNSIKFHHPRYDYIFEVMKKHKIVKLKQLLKESIFSGIKPEYDRNEGTVPVIKTINIKDGFIDYTTEDYVNLDFLNSVSQSEILHTDDIIITAHGEGRGKIGILDDNSIEYAITDTNCSVVRLKERVNKRYVYYYLISELGKVQLKIHEAETKSVRYIPNKEIERLLIIYSNVDRQEQIVQEIERKLKEQRRINKKITNLKVEIDKSIEEAVVKEGER